MTTLNTIIEEEKKRFDRHFLGTEPDGEWGSNEIKNGTWTLFAYAAKNYLTTAMQRSYEAGVHDAVKKVLDVITIPVNSSNDDQRIWYRGLGREEQAEEDRRKVKSILKDITSDKK